MQQQVRNEGNGGIAYAYTLLVLREYNLSVIIVMLSLFLSLFNSFFCVYFTKIASLEETLDEKDKECENIRAESSEQLKECLLAREESRSNLQAQIKQLVE